VADLQEDIEAALMDATGIAGAEHAASLVMPVVEAALAGERERIRQLAVRHGAVYCQRGACTCIRLGSSPTIRSFAHLITEETSRG